MCVAVVDKWTGDQNSHPRWSNFGLQREGPVEIIGQSIHKLGQCYRRERPCWTKEVVRKRQIKVLVWIDAENSFHP